MPTVEQQARLEEAFERIEETILPCISMMLETLIEASEHVAEGERRQISRIVAEHLGRRLAPVVALQQRGKVCLGASGRQRAAASESARWRRSRTRCGRRCGRWRRWRWWWCRCGA